MPGPSKWNREAKARNDARKARARGGRTRSEAGLGRSMAASGRKVSRTNTRVPRANRVKAVRSPILLPEVQQSVERLRKKWTPDLSESPTRQRRENFADSVDTQQKRNRAERKLENDLLRTMPTRGEALKAAPKVRKSTQLNAEGTRVERLAGATQVGNEGVRAVKGALRRGKIERRGNQFTTPKVRRVERKVKKAQRKVRKAKAAARSGITGPLTPGQKKFVSEFSKRTGINPRVAGAWALSEMSGQYAQGREADSNHNWLNIAYFDSGPGTITKDAVWSDPTSAAKASAQFLRGKRFGASQGIQNILPQSRGASDETQIQAIAGSGWASSGYEGGNSLRGTRDLIGYKPPSRKAKARLDRAKARAETIDQEAARLGLPGTKGLPKDGKQAIEQNYRIRKEKGAWAGSQALIQKILGVGPNLADDKEDRGGGNSFHDLSNLTAYAQDIPISGGLEEGEPAYDQALLDKVTRRIRKMGGKVPDLTMGMGYVNGYLQGYTLEIIPDSLTNSHGTGPHLHIGAKWTGEKPPPGTQLGGSGGGGGGGSQMATGSVGPSGTSVPSEFSGQGKNALGPREILEQLGYEITGQGIRRTGLAAGISGTDGDEKTVSTSQMKRRYGVK